MDMPEDDLRRSDEESRMSGWHHSLGWGEVPQSVAPYVPSPVNVVKRMLELAKAGPDDVVYDLGCGDGRILFHAVQDFNVSRAVGYDLNKTMCESVESKVRSVGLEDRIKVVNKNFFLADLSQATIITLYLTTSGNTKLKPKLEKELSEGARIVSHDFPVHGWRTWPDGEPCDEGSHKIYLYRIPEAYDAVEADRTPGEAGRWSRLRGLFDRHAGG